MQTQLSTKIMKFRLFFKDREQKPINLTEMQKERICHRWAAKANPVEVGDYKFSYLDIKRIEPIKDEVRQGKNYSQAHDRIINHGQNWRKWFMKEFEKYKFMNERDRAEFRGKNKYRAFQYDFLTSFPAASLGEKSAALAEFILQENDMAVPPFVYQYGKKAKLTQKQVQFTHKYAQ